MMRRLATLAFTTLVAAGTVIFAGSKAEAADLTAVYTEDSGACGEAWVLNTISKRFDYQVKHVPNLPDVSITDFRSIHQHRYEPAEEQWPIGRRYCGATVDLSDGRPRDIWYLIEEGQGFASMGDNVEFCVAGFDRWMVYNGRCRVLR
jgi:hypothetical protein